MIKAHYDDPNKIVNQNLARRSIGYDSAIRWFERHYGAKALLGTRDDGNAGSVMRIYSKGKCILDVYFTITIADGVLPKGGTRWEQHGSVGEMALRTMTTRGSEQTQFHKLCYGDMGDHFARLWRADEDSPDIIHGSSTSLHMLRRYISALGEDKVFGNAIPVREDSATFRPFNPFELEMAHPKLPRLIRVRDFTPPGYRSRGKTMPEQLLDSPLCWEK